MATGTEASSLAATADVQLPQIRRLRVCLLGGDAVLPSVGRKEIASSLLRGLTADQPGVSDPVLDLAYDNGVFEQAWSEFAGADQQPAPPPGVPPMDFGSDRWGIGPASAWDAFIRLDPQGWDESVPPEDSDPTEEIAFLVAGDPQKNALGHRRTTGIFQAFREALGATRQEDVDAFEKVHREIYSESETKPRQLVRRDSPCSGLLASFARHSPEVGNLAGCGSVVLHVFEPGFWPWGNYRNVAVLCAAAPNSRIHGNLLPSQFFCALRAVGSNVSRTVREYNRVAGSQPPTEGRERAVWFQSDLRAQVECYLSDMSLRADPAFQERVQVDAEGWMDLDHLKGPRKEELLDAELLDALSTSTCVETKVSDDGRVFVRRAGGRSLNYFDTSPLGSLRRKFAGIDESICWDYLRKGRCPRGERCRYSHGAAGGGDENSESTGTTQGFSLPGTCGGQPPSMSPPTWAPPSNAGSNSVPVATTSAPESAAGGDVPLTPKEKEQLGVELTKALGTLGIEGAAAAVASCNRNLGGGRLDQSTTARAASAAAAAIGGPAVAAAVAAVAGWQMPPRVVMPPSGPFFHATNYGGRWIPTQSPSGVRPAYTNCHSAQAAGASTGDRGAPRSKVPRTQGAADVKGPPPPPFDPEAEKQFQEKLEARKRRFDGFY
eukprot:TRINITY_DN62561_c0_g1_i1.p1 TRINITY_DN62561_c0_g1~~TRINITY_DN62561_c0_g1_i1.p1  ORF type:complete len:663 (+),score=115.76 TRINITY_DN62561_c0_g1_i1:194-2182(+)